MKLQRVVRCFFVVVTVGILILNAGCCHRRGEPEGAPGGETDDGRYTTGSTGTTTKGR